MILSGARGLLREFPDLAVQVKHHLGSGPRSTVGGLKCRMLCVIYFRPMSRLKSTDHLHTCLLLIFNYIHNRESYSIPQVLNSVNVA